MVEISKETFNEERQNILIRFAFVETCYRLNKKNLKKERLRRGKRWKGKKGRRRK